MYASKCILSVLLVGCAVGANGDVLVSWGEGTQEVDFDWIPELNRLTIFHGNGLNYKFWVHDGSEIPGTGVIDNITVDPNAVGDFTLLIQEEYGGPGALDWNDGDLRYDGGTSTILGLYLAGDLATEDHVYLESVSGDIYIAGKLHEDGHSQELTYDLVVDGGIDGEIYINELHGEILVPNGTVTGNITTGAVPGTPRTSGGVNMAGNYSATITINDGFDGQVVIGGRLINEGRIVVTGPNLGKIDLGGDLVAPAQIVCHSSVLEAVPFVQPSIRIRGSLDAGDLGPPPIRIGTFTHNHLEGTIAIDGSIFGHAIDIDCIFAYGPLTFAAVTADYDGWDDGDDWQAEGRGARHARPCRRPGRTRDSGALAAAPEGHSRNEGNAPDLERAWTSLRVVRQCSGTGLSLPGPRRSLPAPNAPGSRWIGDRVEGTFPVLPCRTR